MSAPSTFERINAWIRHSVTIKLLSIGILMLLLLIPASMVENLVQERASTRDVATAEVSAKWGGPQQFTGPVLVVPYRRLERDAKNQLLETTSYACFLPDTLSIDGSLAPERRQRGIYDVVVYSSQLRVKGNFQTASLADWNINPADIRWPEAFVAVGLSDMKGIRNSIALRWDGQPIAFEPGVPSPDVMPISSAPQSNSLTAEMQYTTRYAGTAEIEAVAGNNGPVTEAMSSPVPLPDAASLARKHTFEFTIALNGSSALFFAPLGRETRVKLQAPWPDPSFGGAFLPRQHSITPQGFQANWRVLHLNRSYPQRWRTADFRPDVDNSAFGARLIVPVDEYQKNMRAAKYALLPISLTFLIFFFVEVLNRQRIHPFQYILVGLGLVIFYVLLLALSEHMPFNAAYGLAGLAIIGLVTAYAASIFRQRRLTLITAGVLLLVYGFVFVVLQLQDYALLIGSLGLVLVLATVMYLSRRINWYDTKDAAAETSVA
ncbi:cell envelope integrity protein CreD [Hymenobacter endophyticus]|uniref:Cell envelope integrity protein CreD n=1 Tax=Hymenobacter endophyticus TaxID=3076335 RepID=A0ABU3TKQ4_9BACT|nr:cell envelope integrity protein CreD [Hymenobacter endophyticus]MDU0371946.1 cell envelope integrity protein CreD [Hymenobacter endophyticus]